jgi:hypothetical protein
MAVAVRPSDDLFVSPIHDNALKQVILWVADKKEVVLIDVKERKVLCIGFLSVKCKLSNYLKEINSCVIGGGFYWLHI